MNESLFLRKTILLSKPQFANIAFILNKSRFRNSNSHSRKAISAVNSYLRAHSCRKPSITFGQSKLDATINAADQLLSIFGTQAITSYRFGQKNLKFPWLRLVWKGHSSIRSVSEEENSLDVWWQANDPVALGGRVWGGDVEEERKEEEEKRKGTKTIRFGYLRLADYDASNIARSRNPIMLALFAADNIRQALRWRQRDEFYRCWPELHARRCEGRWDLEGLVFLK